jgi:phosphoglycerol transferase MdoB-like AlkP superfamily enzyme
MDKFIPRQYFDHVEGHANLEYHIENTSSSDWGAYDEFLFERVFQILNDNMEQPQFVFCLTTSNHPPYTFPNTYNPLPVIIPKHLQYAHTSGQGFTKKHLLAYQYANDCLGIFIKRLQNSPLAENTIVAVTGDHNARAVFDYPDMHPIDKYAVPFILKKKKKYIERIGEYDTDCFASHKDVFPTIYHLALSDVSYVKSGVNLFNKQLTDTNFGVAENNVILTRNGCVRFEMKPVYYVWTDATRTVLKPAAKDDLPALHRDLLYGRSYLASMTYLIQRSLLDK